MKKVFIPILLIAAAFFALIAPAFAQTPKSTPAPKQLEVVSPFDASTPDTLVLKKQKIETDLRATLTMLTGAYSRIQIAISRLSDKKIDTGMAQGELTLAGNALIEAKTAVDTFSKIAIPDEKLQTPTTVISLKTDAKKAEDALTTVRTRIIASLAILKTALTAPLETQ